MKSVAARNNAQVNRNRPPNTGVERSKKTDNLYLVLFNSQNKPDTWPTDK